MKSVLLTVLALVLPGIILAQEANVTGQIVHPRLIGLLMYADWCKSCKVLEPKLDEVKRDFEEKGVLFTRFDMTDDFTRTQSRLFASWVGLEKIFEENEGRTGYMLLIDPGTKQVVSKLVKTQTSDELGQTIQSALDRR